MTTKAAYMDNTGKDTRMFHAAIIKAIENGGAFDDDLADIFTLTKTPAGSAVDYVLNFA
jgi:hypothetical protein